MFDSTVTKKHCCIIGALLIIGGCIVVKFDPIRY